MRQKKGKKYKHTCTVNEKMRGYKAGKLKRKPENLKREGQFKDFSITKNREDLKERIIQSCTV